jgi:hypothetical protein
MKNANSRRRARRLTLTLAFALCGSAAARAEVEPAFNVELGGPQQLSANLGIRVPAGSPAARGYGRGFVFQVQPGIAGGSVNVGWMPISFAATPTQALGVGVKARLLRTWGSPWSGAEPDRTYAGLELAAVVGVKASVGVLWRLGSEEGESEGGRTVVTWGIGIGF